MHVELCQVLLLMLRTAKLAALAVYLIMGAVFNVAVQAVKHNFGVNRANTDGFTKVSGDVARHFRDRDAVNPNNLVAGDELPSVGKALSVHVLRIDINLAYFERICTQA
jgi:hypothetical protein